MRLEVISNYGATTTVISDRATPELIKETMASLDWQQFHQVQLSKPNGEWLEVGGSLNPDEGLAVSWEEAGDLEVIAPASVTEMTSFLLAFLSGGDDWKAVRRRDVAAPRTLDLGTSPPGPKIPLLIGFGFAVFGLMFLAGALMLAQQTYFGLASYYWPTAQGAITRSKLVETSDTDEDGNETITHVAEIEYRYRVGYRDFRAKRISFGGVSSNSAHATMTKYPLGRSVSVHHHPTNPERAVLEPGISIGLLIADLLLWGLIWYFVSQWVRASGRWTRKTWVPRPTS
jgi:hypothetical protein